MEQNVVMDFTEKSIALVGEDHLCKSFYTQYHKKLEIKYFFAINEQCAPLDIFLDGEEGIKYKPLKECLIRGKEILIVLCCAHENRGLYDTLFFNKGLLWGEDYIDFLYIVQYYRDKGEYIGGEISPKKLFIAIGTCQVVNTAKVLCENEKFNSQYSTCIFFDSMYNPCSHADFRRLEGYGAFCDVVFYNMVNVGTTEQRNYEILINKFYGRAKKISMPFYYFRGQLKQSTNSENRYMVRNSRMEHFWLRGDKEINHLVETGYTAAEILKIVSQNDYWSIQEIQDHFKIEIKKIAVWDRFSSFPIRNYIEKNYQKRLVFVDDTHFSVHLCLYLANEIANELNIGIIDNYLKIHDIEEKQKSVMPVYPCVRYGLGMDIQDRFKFYNLEQGRVEYLGFEEYIEKYIKYVISIRDIYKKYGTIFDM